MFCTKCGNKNDDAVKFCTSCGNVLIKPVAKTVEHTGEVKPVTKQVEYSAEVKNNVGEEFTQPKMQQPQPILQPVSQPTQQPYSNQIQPVENIKRKSPVKILIVILLLFAVTGAVAWWYFDQEKKKKYFVREYSAIIKGSVINFTLVRQGFAVSGNFTSTNTNQTIPLKGTIDAQNNFTLYTENKREVYKGRLEGTTNMNGKMSKVTGEDAVEINLTATGK